MNNTIKINILQDRLVSLALLEYDKVKETYKNKDKFVRDYIDEFINMVMNNPKIINQLDSLANKNIYK